MRNVALNYTAVVHRSSACIVCKELESVTGREPSEERVLLSWMRVWTCLQVDISGSQVECSRALKAWLHVIRFHALVLNVWTIFILFLATFVSPFFSFYTLSFPLFILLYFVFLSDSYTCFFTFIISLKVALDYRAELVLYDISSFADIV